MAKCPHCGLTDDPRNGIIVGSVGEGRGISCTICRADELYAETLLSKRESEVAAHKQITGASHAKIAEHLDLNKSTVDESSRRLKLKIRKAARTKAELSELV